MVFKGYQSFIYHPFYPSRVICLIEEGPKRETDNMTKYQEVALKEQQSLYDLYEHFIKNVSIAENEAECLEKENKRLLKIFSKFTMGQENLDDLLGSQRAFFKKEGLRL